MKAFFIIVLLAASMFVIYKQKEKIDTLTQSLTEQTEKADKLQMKVSDLEKALADAKKLARVPIQAQSRLLQPDRLQPAGQQAPAENSGSLLDPNHRTSLDSAPKK